MKRAALMPLLLLLAACGAESGGTFSGYVEGEFIAVAPQVGGRIVELAVDRGERVEAGAALFRLDAAEAEAAVAQARAGLARSEAELANLRQGQRPPEIAVIEAEIAEAEASVDTAEKEFERQRALFERRVVSEARLDQAREAVDVAQARLASARQRREVATLPARTPQIEAGEGAVEAARAALQQAGARLAYFSVTALAAGRIENVYYRQGEMAAAGVPVLSLLPDGARKVIVFVPEPARPAFAVGRELSIACDGCPDGLTAKVTFLATEAEFTPPVIYSRERREKLVFRVEAALGEGADAIPLGQPVDVTLAGPAP